MQSQSCLPVRHLELQSAASSILCAPICCQPGLKAFSCTGLMKPFSWLSGTLACSTNCAEPTALQALAHILCQYLHGTRRSHGAAGHQTSTACHSEQNELQCCEVTLEKMLSSWGLISGWCYDSRDSAGEALGVGPLWVDGSQMVLVTWLCSVRACWLAILHATTS